MTRQGTSCSFDARLLRPKDLDGHEKWAFVVLPQEVSATLPRRGRTTAAASLNDHRFTVLLEPDGQKSHWLRIDENLLEASGAKIGDIAHFEIMSVEEEPEPEVPEDLAEALASAPLARVTWEATTAIARVDWIHWITSAKQAKTRTKRINDACDMLASGKKRVCCFDPSGFYSKAFSAPVAEE